VSVRGCLLDLRGEEFPVFTSRDSFECMESLILGGKSCPEVEVVVEQPSGFLGDEHCKSGERGGRCWVGCEGDVVVNFVRIAPRQSEPLD
jgi:hypothetical protein